MVQEALEQEVADYLGRECRERSQEGQHGLRNRHGPEPIRTAEGEIVLQVPQARGARRPQNSKLMELLRGSSDVLERLVVQMYG